MLFDDMRSPDLTPEALLLAPALGNALAPPTVPLLKNSGTIDLRWRHFCIHELAALSQGLARRIGA